MFHELIVILKNVGVRKNNPLVVNLIQMDYSNILPIFSGFIYPAPYYRKKGCRVPSQMVI